MNTDWLLGFIEGEGCFSVGFIKTKNTKFGYQIKPMFIIKLTESEKHVLDEIRIYLGNIGNIYFESSESNRNKGMKNANDCTAFIVSKLGELNNIIKVLENQRFVSKQKEKDFRNWVQCINMINNKEHLTKEGFLKIAFIRENIHVRKHVNKKKFCEIKNEIEPCGFLNNKKSNEVCSACIQNINGEKKQ